MARLIQPQQDDLNPLIEALFGGAGSNATLGRLNRLSNEGTRYSAEREMDRNSVAAGAPVAPPRPATFAERFVGEPPQQSAGTQEAFSQFINNPEAMDRVFQAKFGEVLNRYGIQNFDKVTRGVY